MCSRKQNKSGAQMESKIDLRMINVRIKSMEEPFQATKMWNDIIYNFCAGIPLKTYRRRFKTYKHCFVARKAIDWLFDFLQNNTNHTHVSRQKVLKLLRKFVTCGIIERVDRKDCFKELSDNGDLYQLKGRV